MAESFLEDQLERIRRLTERMSQVKTHAAELAEQRARDRQQAPRQDPLSEVRDYRTYTGNAGPPRRRSTARESSRRRR